MKVQSPWMGRVRGSAGSMTGSKVYDKNVMRAKAFEVNNPKTLQQQSERGFFAQVQKACTSVSNEELRSLFGVKPKAMSRRNALSSQLTAAFSIVDGSKQLDFSKLGAIGNGQKVSTSFFKVVNGVASDETDQLVSMYGFPNDTRANIIIVAFDTDKNSIRIFNTNIDVQDEPTPSFLNYENYGFLNGYAYMTCSTNGENVSLKDFGTFSIKTRAIPKPAPEPQPAEPLAVQCEGLSQWSNFQFDLAGTQAAGGSPSSLTNGETVVASGFSGVSGEIYAGSFLEAVDANLASSLVVTMPDTSVVTLPVTFVVNS